MKLITLLTCITSVAYAILLLIQYIILVRFTKKTFTRLNTKFGKDDTNTYSDLKIYKQSVPLFNYSTKEHIKKDRVLLLISGYRDVPYMWNNYCIYLKNKDIDYYAPRTTGNGRRFFQKSIKWDDWILTYFEAIIFLSKIYNNIEIVGFSTGCNIGTYLMGIDWDKIDEFDKTATFNNLILISPNFEVAKKHKFYKDLLKSKIAYNLLNFICPIGDKPSYNKKVEIDIVYTDEINKIFYERSVFLESLNEVWKFSDIMPSKVNIKNIIMYYGDCDSVVGDFYIQRKKLGLIFNKKIKMYKLKDCGHNLINEHPKSRNTLFNAINNKILEND